MKPIHAAIPHAARRRATAAAGFSLIEVIVVILLLLAIASIALPVATTWFSDAAADQTLDTLTLAIRDEQLEAMVTRTPRAVWIEGGDAAASFGPAPRAAAASAPWRLGGESLAAHSPPDRTPTPSSPPSRGQGSRRESVALPRGWTLSVETLAPSAAPDAGEPAAPDDSAMNAAPTSDPEQGPSTRLAVFWPDGQVDVLGVLLVADGGGREWTVELDPWTGVPAWRIRAREGRRTPLPGRLQDASP